jgi:neutral ceramidase
LKWNPARRALAALASAALAAAAAVALLSLPWRADRPLSPPVVTGPAAGDGPLLAGLAVRPLELGQAPTIGGFPRWRWRADGVRDPVGARALLLEEPGARVALVSVEILLIPEPLDAAVRARLADLGLDALVLAATHTHAGPGGYWDSTAGRLGATGPYDPATLARLADDVAAAVRAAWASRAPATLAVTRARLEGLVRNRTGAEADGRLLVVRLARPGGEPVAELVGFSAHATFLGKSNRQVSGDWPGRLLAAGARGPRIFFQGAIGDQSVRLPPTAVSPGEAEHAAYARLLGDSIDVLASGPLEPSPRLAVASAEVTLPPLGLGALPAWLRPAARSLLGGLLPGTARVTAVRLGSLLLVATPAEPVEAVGRAWRAAAGPGASLISLAGGYVGYVDTAARFTAGVGEAHRSYYGPELAERLEAAVAAAARAAGAPPGPSQR